MKLIVRDVESAENGSDRSTPWIEVDVGEDMFGIDADVGSGGGGCVGNGGVGRPPAVGSE